jgi:hypothetical protein
VWGTSPGGHGPVGWRQRARLANNAASGCAAAQAIRTRLAVSTLCAATLIRRIRKVVNSAVARRWGLGIVSRTLSISHWAPVCTWRHSGSRSNGGRQVPVSGHDARARYQQPAPSNGPQPRCLASRNVVDTIGLAPRHHLGTAVMAVAADGQPCVGPLAAEPAHQASQMAADFYA